MVLLLALVLIFLVLLFEFGTFTAPVAILSSAVLSSSGVFLALLITRTTFNVSSFMGLIMVVGIVAKNGILLSGCESQVQIRGICDGRSLDSGWTTPPPSDRNDGDGSRRGNGATLVGMGSGIADAAASCDRRHRRNTYIDDLVVDYHARGTVLPQPFVSRQPAGNVAMVMFFVYIANRRLQSLSHRQCES